MQRAYVLGDGDKAMALRPAGGLQDFAFVGEPGLGGHLGGGVRLTVAQRQQEALLGDGQGRVHGRTTPGLVKRPSGDTRPFWAVTQVNLLVPPTSATTTS